MALPGCGDELDYAMSYELKSESEEVRVAEGSIVTETTKTYGPTRKTMLLRWVEPFYYGLFVGFWLCLMLFHFGWLTP